MGAAAAAAAATAKRKRLERQAAADSSLLDEWFKTFDVSHTGAFERSEVRGAPQPGCAASHNEQMISDRLCR